MKRMTTQYTIRKCLFVANGLTSVSSLADHFATDALMDHRAAAESTEFYPLPACRVYLRDGTG
jgi:hypothetical protein